MARAKPRHPPIVVISGDEEFQKSAVLRATLDRLLPPEVDRALALAEYDGTRSEEAGGPSYAAVMDDLLTLPFLADRRVVVIRDADKFVSAHRTRLEEYLARPAPTGVLVLECRTFLTTTRLAKAIPPAGGELHACKSLRGAALVDFAVERARALGKRLDARVAQQIVALVGDEQGLIASEIEKLCLFAIERPEISAADVTQLVGESREEVIFAVMDSAGIGRRKQALELWERVLSSDPDAVYRTVGGVAFVLRRWLSAHEMLAERQSVFSIAPKVGMYGRAQELEQLLRRLPPARIRRALAQLADLDTQSKLGARSIETGVTALLCELSA
jgi:DNA polymerase-3 subunit delta